ncbi:peptide ABC transporter substrate-binding protein [Salinisphaera hydrothermalis]|uniref:peptide ABC transporter substrate-binding protein n=1 Tax=Salinisphaera hydrothermalis TaxID=563188 RepID=UPI003341BB9A
MRRLRIISVALLVCIGLVGCGSGEDHKFPNRISPDIGPDGTKTLRKGNGAEPQTLDPAQASGVPAANVLYDMYEGLVTYSRTGDVIPGVAKSWDVSDDGKTYIFHLRHDARWSNGKPVTAQDFVFSLRRAVAPATASPYADIHSPIVNASAITSGKKDPSTLGVTAIDAHTLKIQLHDRTPFFLQTLAHPSSYPVYPPAVKQWGNQFTQPAHAVSDGAYVLKSWQVNNKIVLTRNRYYRDNKDTKIDRVVYYPIGDSNSELSRYQSGALDFTYSAPSSKLEAIHKHIPKQMHAVPGLGLYYLGFNVTRPPFKDNPKLRMALSMALDRRIIVQKILRGGQPPGFSYIPGDMHGYDSVTYPWTNWPDKKREAMARKLYHEAGYSKDHPLKVKLLYPSSESNKQIAIVASAMWRRVLGADVIPWNQEWKVYLSTVHRHIDTTLFFAGWIGDYQDPNTFLSILNSHSGNNEPGWDNAAYDRLQSASEHMPNGPQRTAVMHKAEALILKQNPVVPLWFVTNHHLIKPYVKGFVGNPLDVYLTRYLNIVPAGHKGGGS